MTSDRIGWGWRSFGLGVLLSLAGHAAVLAWIVAASTAPVGPSQGDPAILVEIVLTPPAVAPAEPSRPPEVVPPRPATMAARPHRVMTAAPPVKPAPAPVGAGESDPLVPDTALASVGPASASVSPTDSAPVLPDRDEAAEVRRYAEAVWTHLLAHRPRGVRRRGTVLLAFTVSRDGTVIQAAIVRSSGEELLDRAVLAGLAAAAPFPSPPDAIGDTALSFSVPVQVR
ncbi:TonB family protein [Magnetospirillum fulvum]|uniref:TonB C terminal n=1 Tax=Magnetospirillum fulvum TaxID=1082 RepID=A0A1H6GUA1_MAGFU|nr:TonB family protein [Magnetospirillum fulvum]SEH25433.1 TonB C terminal [Magnetospirillum fulvum]